VVPGYWLDLARSGPPHRDRLLRARASSPTTRSAHNSRLLSDATGWPVPSASISRRKRRVVGRHWGQRESSHGPRRGLPCRSGSRAIGCGLSCESVKPDFPDSSLVSAWRLCLFREKPGVSDDFLRVTNPLRVLLTAKITLQELQHFPRVITRQMIAVDERQSQPQRPPRAESGLSQGLRLSEFSGLLGGDGGTRGGMDPILLSRLGRGGRFAQARRLRQQSGLRNRLSIG
jgi:hypothetical protein